MHSRVRFCHKSCIVIILSENWSQGNSSELPPITAKDAIIHVGGHIIARRTCSIQYRIVSLQEAYLPLKAAHHLVPPIPRTLVNVKYLDSKTATQILLEASTPYNFPNFISLANVSLSCQHRSQVVSPSQQNPASILPSDKLHIRRAWNKKYKREQDITIHSTVLNL
jgi:hypothetical protein